MRITVLELAQNLEILIVRDKFRPGWRMDPQAAEKSQFLRDSLGFWWPH